MWLLSVYLLTVLIGTNFADICPDASICPGVESCCPLSSNDFGCCPYPGATCCSDHQQCCPAGNICIAFLHLCVGMKKNPDGSVQSAVSDTAQLGVHQVSSNKMIQMTKVKSQPCGFGTCPDDSTCCGSIACCPLQNAECCPDNLHCCPQGTHCDMQRQGCYASDGYAVQSFGNTNTVQYESIYRPCGQGFCKDETTCCGEEGCCPFPNAECCADSKHCCPNGMKCDVKSEKCIPKEQIRKIHNYGQDSAVAKPIAKGTKAKVVYCPDHSTYCPDYNTCCQMPTGAWGCCPHISAVCCTDNIHCCPQGSKCDPSFRYCLHGNQTMAALSKTEAYHLV